MTKQQKPVPQLPGFETAPELKAADYIPEPGQVFGALRAAVEGLPSTVIEMANLAPDWLHIPDFEAGG